MLDLVFFLLKNYFKIKTQFNLEEIIQESKDGIREKKRGQNGKEN